MRTLIGTATVCVAIATPTFAAAQSQSSFTEQSYLDARATLEQGIAVMGGAPRLEAIGDVRFTSHARIPEVGQSAAPDAPNYVRPLETKGVFDLTHRRYSLTQTTNYIGSGPRPSNVVTTDKTGFAADLRAHALYPIAPSALAARNRGVLRTFPFLFLQTALTRANTLRSLGTTSTDGRAEKVITFTDLDGSVITLVFDAQTGRLARSEGVTDTFLGGLSPSETAYSDYRAIDGVEVPFHVVTRIGGTVTSDATYDEVAFNTHPDSTLFERPKGFEVGPEVAGPAQPITLTKLGRDVYFVNALESGGIFFYSSLFVVFDDYVLVVEAPLSPFVAGAVINTIKETAPGKPIRYLALTHYHTDHSGGVRAYIAEGSTIVTTPGNRGYLEGVASVVHPFAPDALSRHPRPLSVETFSGMREFSDANHRVELHALGPTPHVDEMVLVYIPSEKLAFVSDLFLVSFKGSLGPAEPATVYFDEKLRELHLDVETIAGGHGRIGTIAELRESLANRASQKR